jgi:hypothetical protein
LSVQPFGLRRKIPAKIYHHNVEFLLGLLDEVYLMANADKEAK